MSGMRTRAALAATATAALLAPLAAQARAQETLVIKVTSVSLAAPVVKDNPPKGVSKGDKIIQKDDLLNAAAQFGRKKGARVGSDSGTITFTSKTSARFDGRAVLPGGTLTLRGEVMTVAGGGFTIPVAGGTGRFKGAHGILRVGSGTKRALNTYTLTLPFAPVA
jgi:hypothetical protein